MQPAGLAAFAGRRENKSGIYAYENRPGGTARPRHLQILAGQPGGVGVFRERSRLPTGSTAIWQIVSAKQEATRQKRLAKLIAACAAGKRLF